VSPVLTSELNDDSETSSVEYLELKQAQGEAWAVGGAVKHYRPIDGYEGLHRWDPTAEWTEKEEKQLIRRVSDQLSDPSTYLTWSD
jgi:hypothetical protein